jgi:hypothetical protein
MHGSSGGWLSVAGPSKRPDRDREKQQQQQCDLFTHRLWQNQEQVRVKCAQNSQSPTNSPAEPGELPVLLGHACAG